MFKTDKYKIQFRREESVIRLPFKNPAESKDIYQLRTIVWCYISKLGQPEIDVVHGSANSSILHPNDMYDKIKGKKIALAKTLKQSELNLDKVERALIWQAFWEWVDSWETKAVNDITKNLVKQFPDLLESKNGQRKE